MLDGDEESQELNRFLSTNRVLLVERHFVSDGSRSAWAVCVSYLDRGGRPGPEQGKRVDYREVLSEADFAVFVKLRNLRKSMSEKEGLPAYTLFRAPSAVYLRLAYANNSKGRRSEQSTRRRLPCVLTLGIFASESPPPWITVRGRSVRSGERSE
jgi:hypothetical protein